MRSLNRLARSVSAFLICSSWHRWISLAVMVLIYSNFKKFSSRSPVINPHASPANEPPIVLDPLFEFVTKEILLSLDLRKAVLDATEAPVLLLIVNVTASAGRG